MKTVIVGGTWEENYGFLEFTIRLKEMDCIFKLAKREMTK